jgi:UDP-N-acetylglucosamine 2-epimerase
MLLIDGIIGARPNMMKMAPLAWAVAAFCIHHSSFCIRPSGARPNMMKMAPPARALAADGTFKLRLIHADQHYGVQVVGIVGRCSI